MTEIREVLRAWLAGAGLHEVAAQAGVDRKTARRYMEAAVLAGLAREGAAGQLTDELAGQVAGVVLPGRPDRRGSCWKPATPGSRSRYRRACRWSGSACCWSAAALWCPTGRQAAGAEPVLAVEQLVGVPNVADHSGGEGLPSS